MTKDDMILTSTTNVTCDEAVNFYANGYDSKQKRYYEVFQISDINQAQKLVAVPSSDTAASPTVLIKALANSGAIIPKSLTTRNKLFDRIDRQRASNTNKTVAVTEQIGWLDSDHKKFIVSHDKIYGHTDGNKVILIEKYTLPQSFSVSGTLNDWQSNVAKYCCDNANLLFTTASAFAPPLMSILNIESGGFQLVGESSIGKTTSLKVAASVYGNNLANWNSTINAITRKAVSYNDTLLVIDETGQADNPKDVIDAIYKLAGGQGRDRLNDDAAMYGWRILFLSSSEKTIEQLALDANKHKSLQLGQHVRLIDIAAKSSDFGAVDNIHGCSNSKEFIDMLNVACHKYYGSAGDAYLKQLVAWAACDIEGLKKWLSDKMNHYYVTAKIDLDKGINSRIAERFALVYAAGHLAKEFKILPKECNVYKAVRSCHKRIVIPEILIDPYKANLHTEKLEPEDCIMIVKKFIIKNQKNFIKIGNESKKPKDEAALAKSGINYTNIKNKTEYLFIPDYFSKTVCAGYSNKAVKQSLREAGLLLSKDGATAQRPLTRGDNTTRVIAIDSAIVNFKPIKI